MSAIPVSVGPSSAPVPPTLFAVMTVAANPDSDGIAMAMIGKPYETFDAADAAAAAAGVMCIVMRWQPVAAYRGPSASTS